MSTSGGPNRQLPPSNVTAAATGSLLLSPPTSRTFPFRSGSSYLDSAVLVPYDDDDGSRIASNSTPTSMDEIASRQSPQLHTTLASAVGSFQSFGQQPLTAVDCGSRPPPMFELNIPPPPPANVPLAANQLGLHAVSSPLPSLPFDGGACHPPHAATANTQLPTGYTNPEISSTVTGTHHFNPYSSSSPVVYAGAPPVSSSTLSSAMPIPAVNPYSRSASADRMSADLVATPTGTQWSPSSGNVSEELAPIPYARVHPHWFYCKEVEKKLVWHPFSLLDSYHLEEVHNKADHQEVMIVATDGGRYDVYVHDRVRYAVYWDEDPMAIRRATWFYRLDGDRAFLPYEEHFSEKLEEEYEVAVTANTWHRRLEFPEGETVVIHNPQVIVHYKPAIISEWDGATEGQMKPRVVRRGMDDAEIVDDGESMQIDHLVFVVHGIGAICDLKFRTLPEAVGDFRIIANGLLASHFRNHVESGRVGRVEFLPVSWHNFLHGDATGIDEKLKPITLKSIPKLRYFANDTILDVLFYTSPVYCQAIINQVSSEINRIHALFLRRNPSFTGKVSLAGHSLGSVILFDLLDHQPPSVSSREKSSEESCSRSSVDVRSPTPSSSPAAVDQTSSSNDLFSASGFVDSDASKLTKRPSNLEEALQQLDLDEYTDVFQREKIDLNALALCSEDDMKEMGIPLGPRKRILGLVRQIKDDSVGVARQAVGDPPSQATINHTDTALATSGRRRKPSETMINYVVGMAGTGHPCVIYPRLDFRPTCFFAMGSPVAMFLTIRGHDTVWDNFRFPNCPAYYNIFHPFDPVAYRMEPLIEPSFTARPVLIPHHKGRKRMHLEIKESLSRVGADLKQKVFESLRSTWNTIHEFAKAHRASAAQLEAEVDRVVEDEFRLARKSSLIDDDLSSTISAQDQREEDFTIGQLNGGRRIDYVLQEKPIESFNEYLFALQSHTCYWESEDTVLLMLKEIYSSYGIHPNSQVPDPHTKQPSAAANDRQSQQTFARSASGSNWDRRPSQSPSGDFASMTADRSSTPSNFAYSSAQHFAGATSREGSVGIDPTAPPSYVSQSGSSATAPPPPLAGFVKQSAFRK